MQSELSSFEYLWDGSSPQWVLLNIKPEGDACYLIVNIETKSAKLIENDEIFAEVISRMLGAKVRVVSKGNGF